MRLFSVRALRSHPVKEKIIDMSLLYCLRFDVRQRLPYMGSILILFLETEHEIS